jgi:hypothetical protein
VKFFKISSERRVWHLALGLFVWLCVAGGAHTTNVEKDNAARPSIARPFKPGAEIRLRLDGAQYVAPSNYFTVDGARFYWPSRTPGLARGDWPERGQPFYDVAIEIFLQANRARTPYKSGPERLEELRKSGRVLSQRRVSDELEIWETREKSIPATWFVALRIHDVSGAPYTVSCHHYVRGGGRCLGAFYWQPEVNSTFRFDLRHGPDWPAIAEEIKKIMQSVRRI